MCCCNTKGNVAKYQPQQTDEEVLAIAEPEIRTTLKDPNSLQNLKITQKFKGYASKMGPIDNISPKYDYGYWIYQFSYQATNSYGGVVRGSQYAIYHNGIIYLEGLGLLNESVRRSDNITTFFRF